MLCSRFKQILLTRTTLNNNVQYRCFVNTRFASKKYGWESFWASLNKHRKEIQIMGSLRFIFKELSVNRLWSVWSRSVIVGHVVKRCRKDRSVREVIHTFRQTFSRPRRSLLFYATAACKAKNNDEKPGKPQSCSKGIDDQELEDLLTELDGIEELTKQTLYCENCDKRIVLNKEYAGVLYCPCKESKLPEGSPDGWEPYMEADDVIIWRKEYKAGQGLYAYKVYGRYKDVKAEDFAAVNIDSGYRRKWDNAVAALAVVERNFNGVPDQTVLHWEVLWPRLFANRDYVYIRRHKEFSVRSVHSPHVFDDPPSKQPKTAETPQKDTTANKQTDDLTPPKETKEVTPPNTSENNPPTTKFVKPPMTPPRAAKQDTVRSSVHDRAKQKSLEMYSKNPDPPKTEPIKTDPQKTETPNGERSEKVYVIISRSCTHPAVPTSRNAIRVSEYWSHMVVKTLEGDGKVGMEYVLTYYDEPAVGGMPSGVTAWAASRGMPVFLAKLREASKAYASYRRGRKEEAPDFEPFVPETKKICYEGDNSESVREEDMESSKTGPDINNGDTHDRGTQTDETHPPDEGAKVKLDEVKFKVTEDKAVNTVERHPDDEQPTRPKPLKVDAKVKEEDLEKDSTIETAEPKEEESDEENTGKGSWWRYIYPPYYLG